MDEFSNELLNQVVFISIPQSFQHHLQELSDSPPSMLPVDTGGDPSEWNPEELSWEMILSGMLKVLAHQPDHDDVQYYRTFIEHMRPQMITELSETGIIAARNENYSVAEEVFQALTGLAPDRIEGPVNLAISYEQRADSLERIGDDTRAQRHLDRAYQTYRELLEREELPADVYLNAGMFFAKIRNYDAAHTQLLRFVEESDDEEKSVHARRVIHEIESQNLLDQLFKEAYDFIRMGDEETGIARIREFLERYPTAWNAWFLLGWGHRRRGEYQEAVEAFDQAVEQGANNADTYNELAICRMELGEYQQARLHLVHALQLEPDNTKVMSNFGVLALKEDDPEEARRYFSAVAELEPEDPVAQRYLKYLDER
ncbi:MAG: tetratricopeptide repeat protein [Alkalispirochaeta sp.]